MPELMIKTPVEVTKVDYDVRHRCRPEMCLIARAISRAIKTKCWVAREVWGIVGEGKRHYPLPPDAMRLRSAFDTGTLDPATLPVTIEFDVPERLLKKVIT